MTPNKSFVSTTIMNDIIKLIKFKINNIWLINELPLFKYGLDNSLIELLICKFVTNSSSTEELLNFSNVENVYKNSDSLYIITKNIVLTVHNVTISIDERCGLIDRFYVFLPQYSSLIFCLKIYKKDIRDLLLNVEKTVYVLGVVRNSHDSGAVLIKNGNIIGAIEEERLLKMKHGRTYFPINATNYLLNTHNINWDDITHIAVAQDYNWYKDTEHTISPRDNFYEFQQLPIISDHKFKFSTERLELFISEIASLHKSKNKPPITFVKHHKCHAYAAYFTSGFKEPTLIFIFDGQGEDEATTIWFAQNNKLKKIKSTIYTNSLGYYYHILTQYLGYNIYDEGKVMGFAPYGKPRDTIEQHRVNIFRDLVKNLLYFDESTGELLMNQNSFNFKHIKTYPDLGYSGDFLNSIQKIIARLNSKTGGSTLKPDIEQHRAIANFAFVIQERLENSIKEIVHFYMNKNIETKGTKYIVISGGVALNISANQRLIEDKIVDADKLYIPAFPADDGSMIGAALSVSQEQYKQPIFQILKKISLGKTYSNDHIKNTLDSFGLEKKIDYEYCENKELIENTAKLLLKNEPVGWFQGGCELGPRALGNRSILYRVNDEEGNVKMNFIKGREKWRPSALSIQCEKASEFLENIDKSPYMTIGFKVKEKYKNLILSGMHAGDGTTRPQTVTKESNPIFWQLLEKVGKLTGIPSLLNTSFNKLSPIVETPEDALNTLYYCKGLDHLVIGNYIVYKTPSLFPSIINTREEPIYNNSLYKAFEIKFQQFEWKEFWLMTQGLFESRNNKHISYYQIDFFAQNKLKNKLVIPIIQEFFLEKMRTILFDELFNHIIGKCNNIDSLNISIHSSQENKQALTQLLIQQLKTDRFKEYNITVNILNEYDLNFLINYCD